MLSASLSSKAAEERFSAFMSILAPSQSVYIISPTTDFSGKSNLVATLVKQIEQLTPNCNKIKADELPLMFYCSTEEAAYSTVVRSFKRDEEYYSIREVLEQNEVYKQKFEYLDELEKSTHKRQHHVIKNTSYIDRLCDKKLNISPSALENYYK